MNIFDASTEQVPRFEWITRRFPLLLFAFILFMIYIGVGYYMQNLMLQEKNLRSNYQELYGTSVMLHNRVLLETEQDSIKFLIDKYKLNIEPQTISPFVIEK